jgi:hypothetical protein
LLLLLAFLPLQIIAQYPDYPTAECKLVVLGHRSSSSSTSDSSSDSSRRHGVAFASLNCTSTDGHVPVIVNEEHLKRYAAYFNGVTALSSSDCKDHAEVNNTRPVTALLYFCSEHQLLLQNPVVQGVTLVDADSTSHPDDPAILLFGGSIDASITGGRFSNNTAGADVVAQQQASVHIQDTTFYSSTAARGLSVYASDSSLLSISNSVFTNMTLAGVILAVTEARITIANSTFSNNVIDAWDDQAAGVIQLFNDATAVITGSTFSSNRAGEGAGVAAYGSAQVRNSLR